MKKTDTLQTNDFLKERILQQEALTEFGLEALSGTDVLDLLNHASEKLRDVLSVEYTKILELLPEENKLIFRAGKGWGKRVRMNKTTMSSGINSQGGFTLLSKKPVIVRDLSVEKRFAPSNLILKHNIVSSMSCIIWSSRKIPYGVLAVHTRQKREFTSYDINFLQSVANVLAMAIDRKRTEEEIQYQASLLEAQKEATSDGILVVNRDGKILSRNQKFIDMWHMPKKIMDSKSDIEALRYAAQQLVDPKKFLQRVDYLYQNSKVQNVDELVFKNRQVFERYGMPVISKAGVYYGYAWYFRDVTEKKKSEEALRWSEKRFSALYDANIIGIVYGVTDGLINDANEAFLSMLGYTRSDLKKGKLNWKTIVPHDQVGHIRSRMRRMRIKGFVEPYEREYIHKNGSRVSVIVGAALLDSGKNKEIAFVVDITERKKLERQKDEFLGVASHELKTPITSIKAYCQVLQATFSRKGDLVAVAQLMKMETQINRLTSLVVDLLDVTKIAAGKMLFNRAYFDWNELVNEIIEEVQRTTDRHTIIANLTPTKTLSADRDRIGQVLTNLLTNAIKYSPNSNMITVTSTGHKDHIEISIADRGVGIAKEKESHLFERFYRAEDGGKNTFAGLGLGLYISNEIVKRHGGKMWFISKLGRGSTFYFTVPIHDHEKKSTNNRRR